MKPGTAKWLTVIVYSLLVLLLITINSLHAVTPTRERAREIFKANEERVVTFQVKCTLDAYKIWDSRFENNQVSVLKPLDAPALGATQIFDITAVNNGTSVQFVGTIESQFGKLDGAEGVIYKKQKVYEGISETLETTKDGKPVLGRIDRESNSMYAMFLPDPFAHAGYVCISTSSAETGYLRTPMSTLVSDSAECYIDSQIHTVENEPCFNIVSIYSPETSSSSVLASVMVGSNINLGIVSVTAWLIPHVGTPDYWELRNLTPNLKDMETSFIAERKPVIWNICSNYKKVNSDIWIPTTIKQLGFMRLNADDFPEPAKMAEYTKKVNSVTDLTKDQQHYCVHGLNELRVELESVKVNVEVDPNLLATSIIPATGVPVYNSILGVEPSLKAPPASRPGRMVVVGTICLLLVVMTGMFGFRKYSDKRR